MSASALAVRRASGPLLRTYDRSNSCPDLSATVARMKLRQPARNLNLMVMHPRAPKIRHLNASHSLLIELEENVKKVQVSQHFNTLLGHIIRFHHVILRTWRQPF